MAFNSKKLTNSPVPGIAGQTDDCCPEWWYDEDRNMCTNIPNCGDGTPLKIFNAEDKFTTGQVSADGSTLTLDQLDGVDGPIEICLDVLSGAVWIDADGVETPVNVVDKILQLEKPEEYCWSYRDDGCVELSVPHCGTGEALVLNFVQSVTGNVVDNTDPKNPVITAVASVTGDGVDNTDPQNPVVSGGTAVSDPVTGTTTQTNPDGTELVSCDAPVKSVSGDGVDATDPQNPIVSSGTAVSDPVAGTTTQTNPDGTELVSCDTPVKSVTGDGVDATDPQNPVVSGGTAVADIAAGTTTQTNPDGTTLVSCDTPVKGVTGDGVDNTDPQNPVIASSSTVPSADGSVHTITTADNVATAVCATQFKGLRDDGNGTYTEVFLNQDGTESDGQSFQLIPDTDQRLANPVITQATANGVTTHTITWDVVDIDGNVVGQETATGIQMPVFTDKAGAPITGPITPILIEQFAEADYATGDKLLAVAADGSCKLGKLPEKDGYSTVGITATGDVDSAGNTIVYIDQNGDPLADGLAVINTYGPDGDYLASYYAESTELQHTDNTVVPNDCVQPSLRGQDGLPLPKGACVAPAEIMTCVQRPASAFIRMKPNRTGDHSVIFTDPLTKASVAMYVEVKGPGVINFESFLDERMSFASARGPNGETEVSYCIRYTWLGTEITTTDCPTTYDWLTTTGDYDEVAAGNDVNNQQSAIFTPVLTQGATLTVSGAATETPPGSGTYVVDAGASTDADAAWFLTTLNPSAGDQHGSDDTIWSRDAIGLNTRVRYLEGIRVYRDCDGNFIRAESALTGLPVLEVDLP